MFVQNLIDEKYSIKVRAENKLCNEVYSQAIRHTQRNDDDRLYTSARPNEVDEITEYRLANIRRLTKEIPEKFLAMASRVFQDSSESIDQLSTQLTDHLKGDFINLCSGVPFNQVRYKYLLPIAIEDPNAIIVEFPFNKNDKESIPNQTQSPNEVISIESRIIPHDKIVHKCQDIIGWEAGKMEVLRSGKDKTVKSYYHFMDKQAYYIYVPTLHRHEIKYELILWYTHNANRLLFAELPGLVKTFREDNEIYTYKESYLSVAFEYLDEFTVSFSNDQGVRALHGNPKAILADIKCHDCNGLRKVEGVKCNACLGTGFVGNPGPFAYIRAASSLKDGKTPDAMKYVEPPVSILSHGWDVVWQLKAMASKSVTLGLLEDAGNESGIAKGLRLEPRQDLMKQFGDDEIDMAERILNNKEALLNINNPTQVNLSRPAIYQIKSAEILKEEARESHIGVRYEANMKYIRSVFRGNPVAIRAYELAYEFAPLLGYNQDELLTAINTTAYDQNDIIKRDRAVQIIKSILIDDPEIEKVKVFQLADNAIKPFLTDSEIPVQAQKREEKKKEDKEGELPKDLDELEEVLTAFILDDMDRETAIKSVMIIEKMTEQEATELVDDIDRQNNEL